jgi:hypothetical protein
MMLRIDRMLGDFFKFLDKQVGLDRTVIVLTGDHGVAPLPETPNSDGVTERKNLDMEALIREAEAALVRDLAPDRDQAQAGSNFLNAAPTRSATGASEIEAQLRQHLMSHPLIERLRRDELLPIPRCRFFPWYGTPQHSGDLMVQLKRTCWCPGPRHRAAPYRSTHVPW